MSRDRNNNEPIAYFNGQFVPESEAKLSIADVGVLQGVTLTERVRTYGGRLFALHDHLSRLIRSAEKLGIEIEEQDELPSLVNRLLELNQPTLETDLAVVFVVTPGIAQPKVTQPRMTQQRVAQRRATCCMHVIAQPRPEWAVGYEQGWTLQTANVSAIPDTVVPREIKHRSRLHWYMAARQMQPTTGPSEPLLLDSDGVVTESAYANVLLVKNGQLIAVSRGRALPGVTEHHVCKIAREIGIKVSRADFTLAELAACEEVLLTSTGYTLAPVGKVDATPIGNGRPGAVWGNLSRAISERVGVDFVEQAAKEFERNQEQA